MTAPSLHPYCVADRLGEVERQDDELEGREVRRESWAERKLAELPVLRYAGRGRAVILKPVCLN